MAACDRPCRPARRPQSQRLRQAIFWGRQTGLSIADQGLISGSNFLITILLARWLSAEQYGGYAIAFGVFILVSLLHQSLVLEPMAVFGASVYGGCLRRYLRVLLWIHVGASAVVAAVLGVTALLLLGIGSAGKVAAPLAGVSIATPMVLLFWMARRAFYLRLSPARAVIGALLYCAVLISSLLVLFRLGRLTAFSAFLCMAVAAASASALLAKQLYSMLERDHASVSLKEIWQRHWKYGKWALGTSCASWIPAYMFYPLLSGWGGISQSGALKSLMNFSAPVEQTQTALMMLLLPYAAQIQAQDKDHRKAFGLSLRMMAASVAVAVGYWALILWFRVPVFHWIYSSRYSGFSPLLQVVALGSLMWSATYGPAIVLRAIESPASVFVAYATAMLFSMAIGIPLAKAWGLPGGIWGMNIADGVSLVMSLLLLRRKIAHAELQTVYTTTI